MNNADIATKLTALETRAAGYTANPGPAGEVQQRATGIIANREVMVIIRDGQVHHYEVTSLDMTVVFAKTRNEAEVALAA